MKRVFFFILTALVFVVPVGGQSIEEVSFEELSPLLRQNNDTTYVVNFWATWCKPCVEEIPHFLELASELKDEKVKFIFVSLDFPAQKESRLLPFIEKYEMDERVILLNDPNSNEWIEKVSPDWSGAIPATLVYRKESSSFHESSLSKEELLTIIKSMTL
ncbi:TlpA disulfide reductase family protein [Marinilabilia salmonicolor]|uniref:Thiol-disulfide isomerase/thioredoxin n=1 Tax=Marinilabilia salmonicolor TaxID=989 RepID=A0A368VCU3_9BACT|nr:TlpA disulfide reductase family protein [Marinilabilia salmonicolor]RCW38948.1 thiol-disulfide isomerase/thioredoxin [Marinilabilia salmonicolor]